jgi:hypothetical protein
MIYNISMFEKARKVLKGEIWKERKEEKRQQKIMFEKIELIEKKVNDI